jgi:two-component system, OmpR family, sensor histidine kinase AdeS
MKTYRFPILPLATLTATIITTMLVLSVSIAYLGVTWYSTYLEDRLASALPPKAAAAYRMINDGQVPDSDALKALLEQVDEHAAPMDFQIQLAVLICGLLSALVCAVIGIYLARRIARPLEDLTVAAKSLASGDFSARVAASSCSTREVSSLVETFNSLATSL